MKRIEIHLTRQDNGKWYGRVADFLYLGNEIDCLAETPEKSLAYIIELLKEAKEI